MAAAHRFAQGIERNAVGAIKAISAARISLRGDGRHFVSLQGHRDDARHRSRHARKYKEISRGRLAVNVIGC